MMLYGNKLHVWQNEICIHTCAHYAHIYLCLA